MQGSFSIIRIEGYGRLDKGLLSQMEKQETFCNRPKRASLDQNKVVACLVWGSEGSRMGT